MAKIKINMTFDCLTWRQPIVSSIIQKCVEATLTAEGVTAPCEINVLVTNDRGIHAINKASRDIDRPTDVLSFPRLSGSGKWAVSSGRYVYQPGTGNCPG